MARTREHIRRWFFAIPAKFWALWLVVLCLCAMLACVAWLTRFCTVTTTEGTQTMVLAPVMNKATILALAGVQADLQDELQYKDLGGGLAQLHVERSFPIDITADGATVQHRVVVGTVAQALETLGIAVGPDDYTEPALTQPVDRSTGHITLYRVSYHDYSIDEVIPFETERRPTSLLYQAKKKEIVFQEGKNGYLKAEMRDKLIDGVVVESTPITVLESVEPVPQILKVYGEGVPISEVEAPAGITINENGEPSSYSTVYEMKATGYYSPRGKGASGLGLYYGTFAVDPRIIPYGTKVYIVSENGKFIYGWAIATDTGAFIHSNNMQVDLFYETYAESAANGVQRVKVYVP